MKIPPVKKYLIHVFTALLGLAAVELAMRAAGTVIQWKVARTWASGDKTVLCIGDSYTLGVDSPLDASYPRLLQKELDASNPGTYRVINGGICEASSRRTGRALESQLKEYSPDIVVVMSGASNFFDLEPEGENIRRDPGPGSDLRILKLLRIAWINSKAALHASSHKAVDDEVLPLPVESPGIQPDAAAALALVWERISAWDVEGARRECLAALSSHPDDINLHYTMAEISLMLTDKKGAMAAAKKTLALIEARLAAPDSGTPAPSRKELELARSCASKRISEIYTFMYKFPKAVSFMLKGLEYGPPSEKDFYRLAHAYSLQSSISAGTIRKALASTVERNPEFRDHHGFLKALAYFADIHKTENRIAAETEFDLRDIIRKSRSAGAETIVTNYPFPYHRAGEAGETAARTEKSRFLDLTSVFAGLLSPEKRDRYFHNTGHCTVEGNLLIAKTVAAEIAAISDDRRQGAAGLNK